MIKNNNEKKITKNAVHNLSVPIDQLRKPHYVEASLFEKVKKHREKQSRAPIQTKSRRSTIIPEFVGLTFEIHNGKTYISRLIIEDMVGHKLGEFAPTRTFKGHAGTKKDNKKDNKGKK